MGPKPAEETERCVMEPCSMAYGTSFGDSSVPSYNGGDRYATKMTFFVLVNPKYEIFGNFQIADQKLNL